METVNAVELYQQGKWMEAYLLVKQAIENECATAVQSLLLQKLDTTYQAGEDLMSVFREMKSA